MFSFKVRWPEMFITSPRLVSPDTCITAGYGGYVFYVFYTSSRTMNTLIRCDVAKLRTISIIKILAMKSYPATIYATAAKRVRKILSIDEKQINQSYRKLLQCIK